MCSFFLDCCFYVFLSFFTPILFYAQLLYRFLLSGIVPSVYRFFLDHGPGMPLALWSSFAPLKVHIFECGDEACHNGVQAPFVYRFSVFVFMLFFFPEGATRGKNKTLNNCISVPPPPPQLSQLSFDKKQLFVRHHKFPHLPIFDVWSLLPGSLWIVFAPCISVASFVR